LGIKILKSREVAYAVREITREGILMYRNASKGSTLMQRFEEAEVPLEQIS
jgi:hypothetical protein